MEPDNSAALEGRVARSQLEEGIFLARHGDREAAQSIFRRLIRRSPEDEQAWLWLAYVAETPEESLRYLAEARAFLPESDSLAEAERQARARAAESQRELAAAADAAPKRAAVGATRARATALRATEAVQDAAARVDVSQTTEAARQGARVAGERVRRAAQAAQQRLPDAEDLTKAAQAIPEVAPQVVRWGVSFVAVAAIVAFIWLGVAPLVGGQGRTVPPLVLAEGPVAAEIASSANDAQAWEQLWGQVERARQGGDWIAVERYLDELRQVGCPDQDARQLLAEGYRQVGLEYLDTGAPEDANRALNWAVRLDAGSAELQETRRAVDLYLQGIQAFGARDWAGVVYALRVVERLSPNFRDTRTMLAEAYYHEGERALEEAIASETGFDDGLYDRAKVYAERAIDMRGSDYPEATDLLTRVNDAIFPPRRIEVELGRFLVTVYENHQPIRTIVVCVGRPSAPTTPGRYKIMNKIPMAYASQWDLDMPNWMGIYYVGDNQQVQNGFHALPFLSSGARLWTQALGTRCSFGCIVVGIEDSDWLYAWAEVGDVVIVKP